MKMEPRKKICLISTGHLIKKNSFKLIRKMVMNFEVLRFRSSFHSPPSPKSPAKQALAAIKFIFLPQHNGRVLYSVKEFNTLFIKALYRCDTR